MADSDVAVGSGLAFAPALVIDEQQKVYLRTTQGGYAQITATTVMYGEEGDIMPGQPRYDNVLSFFPPTNNALLKVQPIIVTGGRDFTYDITVYDNQGVVVDVSAATFVAQIRRYRYAKNALVQMGFEIIDGLNGHVRLSMTPDQTWQLVLCTVTGVWDVEMVLNGAQTTVVPESNVRINPGISRGTIITADAAAAAGVSTNAGTVNS